MRHGEVHNPNHILYGRLPNFYLSEEGKRQAHSAGKWLQNKDITKIYCSPMERAQQTAGIVAEYQTDLTPQQDKRIIEVHTPHDGRPLAELEAIKWDMYTGNEPPYEVPEIILNRVHDFFEFVLDNHDNESVVAVGHGDILVFPWLHAQGVVLPEYQMKDELTKLQSTRTVSSNGIYYNLHTDRLPTQSPSDSQLYSPILSDYSVNPLRLSYAT